MYCNGKYITIGVVICLILIFYILFIWIPSKSKIKELKKNGVSEVADQQNAHWLKAPFWGFLCVFPFFILAFLGVYEIDIKYFFIEESRNALFAESESRSYSGLLIIIFITSFIISYLIVDILYFIFFRKRGYSNYVNNLNLFKVRIITSIIFIPFFILLLLFYINNLVSFYEDKIKLRNYILMKGEEVFFYKNFKNISFAPVYDGRTGKYNDRPTEVEENAWEFFLPNNKRYVLVKPDERLINSILKHSNLKVDTLPIIKNKHKCD